MVCQRLRVLAALVLLSHYLAGTWQAVAGWDQWDRHEPQNGLWDDLIGGQEPLGPITQFAGRDPWGWRAEGPPPPPDAPTSATTSTASPVLSALACNYSDWRPLTAPWPERLQDWDRADSAPPTQKPPRPFRPSQPLTLKPAPTAAPTATPTTVPAPPCYATVQLPRPSSRAGSTTALQLLYSPDPLPSSAWDSGSGTSRCLWTLVAAPGCNISVAVAMGAWGRGGRGSLHLFAQAPQGELLPVCSLHAPAQSSAEVQTRSNVAVLSTALPASATFTLRVTVKAAVASDTASLADILQPPASPPAVWGQQWGGGVDTGKPSKPSNGRPSWRPQNTPYPASSGNVDVETVDITHQHQTTGNCVVQQQLQTGEVPVVDELLPTRDRDEGTLPIRNATATTNTTTTLTPPTPSTPPEDLATPAAGAPTNPNTESVFETTTTTREPSIPSSDATPTDTTTTTASATNDKRDEQASISVKHGLLQTVVTAPAITSFL